MSAALTAPSRERHRIAASRGRGRPSLRGDGVFARGPSRSTGSRGEPQWKLFLNLTENGGRRWRTETEKVASASLCHPSSVVCPAYPPRAARNSCGVVPVCLRKKRAKWEGSEKESS